MPNETTNMTNTGGNMNLTETAEFLGRAVTTLESIQTAIVDMDKKMAQSFNDKSGAARDHIAQKWVEIFYDLRASVNKVGGLLNAGITVQARNTDLSNSH